MNSISGVMELALPDSQSTSIDSPIDQEIRGKTQRTKENVERGGRERCLIGVIVKSKRRAAGVRGETRVAYVAGRGCIELRFVHSLL